MNKEVKIKEKIKERYGKIALSGNSECCCMPSSECSSTNNNTSSISSTTEAIGYSPSDLSKIPESSILGVGCGNPIRYAHIKEGDTIVDLGSGAGIDVFLAANIVKDKGKVIGIDMTDDMLNKAKHNADKYNYKNVEFKKGDIEIKIPVEDNSVDVVISNCVINLTENKVNTFKEVYRILKPNGIGRMVISDLVTSKEIDDNLVNVENWCSCIDGALTKEDYINSIRQSGFTTIEILDEKPYTTIEDDEDSNNSSRIITSLTIKAIKD